MTGIKYYSTKTKGIGGRIKRKISDFIVKEITLEGKTLEPKAFGPWDDKREQPLEIPMHNGEEYLQVSMEKFNYDVNNAIKIITRGMHCSPKRIGYAGMKDKRGITIQKISIWNPDAEKLLNFRSRYISITEPEWKNNKVEIGGLIGNEFEITVREIEIPEKELKKETEKCIKEMEKGVINYFGEQRFGGNREITHKVGEKFIEGKFEEAIMLYLTSPSKEEEEIAIARKNLLETKDFSRAIKEYPKKFRYERAIIHHLCKFPKDFIGAFQKLPRHLVYLFAHAYQSYLFNEILNKRIDEGIGLGATEGDILEDGIATAPLFGFDSKLAEGKPGEIEKKVLKEHDRKLGDFKVKSFPEMSCSGARKKILVFPKNIKIKEITPDELSEGKLKLALSFSLDKGNYATTILRELMKTQ